MELGIGALAQKKTRMMGPPDPEKSLTMSSAVWIQSINVTDGRTDTGRQQRQRLRIASRGKNRNIGAQLQSLACITKLPKTFWKIYFLYDFWCAQTSSFRATFGLPIRTLTIMLSAIYSDLWKRFISMHIYVFRPKPLRWNFTQISQLSILSGEHNFSADCWTFRNFHSQFGENCSTTFGWKCKLSSLLKGQSLLKKSCKRHQNRPIDRHTILVQTMSPSNKQRASIGA